MTSIEAEKRISEQLEAGERVLWTGAPRQGFLFRRSDLLQVPFSLMWAGFMIFWEINALRMEPVWFRYFGIPFVLLGFYFVIGRFFVDIRSRARTAYALTDRRVVIVSGTASRSVRTLPLRTLSDLNLEVGADGSGTITFGAIHPAERWAATAPLPGMVKAPDSALRTRSVGEGRVSQDSRSAGERAMTDRLEGNKRYAMAFYDQMFDPS